MSTFGLDGSDPNAICAGCQDGRMTTSEVLLAPVWQGLMSDSRAAVSMRAVRKSFGAVEAVMGLGLDNQPGLDRGLSEPQRHGQDHHDRHGARPEQADVRQRRCLRDGSSHGHQPRTGGTGPAGCSRNSPSAKQLSSCQACSRTAVPSARFSIGGHGAAGVAEPSPCRRCPLVPTWAPLGRSDHLHR